MSSSNKSWTFVTALHSGAGPLVMLVYPLYASVVAMESATKVDDEQWLAYWIIYSFLTLTELILQSLIEWIPIWYTVKLVFIAWLVLPQFQGAAFIYNRVVREQFKKHGVFGSGSSHHNSNHTKPNIIHSIFPKKSLPSTRRAPVSSFPVDKPLAEKKASKDFHVTQEAIRSISLLMK